MENLEEDIRNFGFRFNKKFNPETMSFLEWRNDFEFIVKLLEIKRKNHYLLKMLEPSVINYISKHVEPSKPNEIPYEMLILILQEKYSPLGLYDSTRMRTAYRTQFLGESAQDYYNAIKELVYQYQDGPQVNKLILKRFIAGLRNRETRAMMEMIPDITLGAALYIAKYTELVENPLIRT